MTVTSLGEASHRFHRKRHQRAGQSSIMEANPGGAPCNVLAMLERLGKKTAFIGKVGKDMFGDQLRKAAVEEVGIDTKSSYYAMKKYIPHWHLSTPIRMETETSPSIVIQVLT